MRTPRSWKREGRLLVIVDALGEPEGVETSSLDVFTADFVLQHPSLLEVFFRQASRKLPPKANASIAEAESTEEAFLRWKRSVDSRLLTPMLGRLIARGLLGQSGDGRLWLRPTGVPIAERVRSSLGDRELARLNAVASQVHDHRVESRRWLAAALGEGTS